MGKLINPFHTYNIILCMCVYEERVERCKYRQLCTYLIFDHNQEFLSYLLWETNKLYVAIHAHMHSQISVHMPWDHGQQLHAGSDCSCGQFVKSLNLFVSYNLCIVLSSIGIANILLPLYYINGIVLGSIFSGTVLFFFVLSLYCSYSSCVVSCSYMYLFILLYCII